MESWQRGCGGTGKRGAPLKARSRVFICLHVAAVSISDFVAGQSLAKGVKVECRTFALLFSTTLSGVQPGPYGFVGDGVLHGHLSFVMSAPCVLVAVSSCGILCGLCFQIQAFVLVSALFQGKRGLVELCGVG